MEEVWYDKTGIDEKSSKSRILTGDNVMGSFNGLLIFALKLIAIPLFISIVLAVMLGGGFMIFFMVIIVIMLAYYIITFVKSRMDYKID